jgi:predicted nucleic acid-binding protein
VIYLDSGAVAKLVRQEEHTADLVDWLNAHPDVPLVSSVLVEVEVPRALRRSVPQALVGAPAAMGRLFRIEVDATIRATAAGYAEPSLRPSDAIHLATAQVLSNESGRDLTAFVTYDARLREAAQAVGFTIACPGRDRTAWLEHPSAPSPTEGVPSSGTGYEWESTAGWQIPGH